MGLSAANGRPGGPWTLELGVKFTVDAPSRLSALSFYKDGDETGGHVGRVWTADGLPAFRWHRARMPPDPRLALTLRRTLPTECPRPESNQRTRFRKPLLYPLSYGGS